MTVLGESPLLEETHHRLGDLDVVEVEVVVVPGPQGHVALQEETHDMIDCANIRVLMALRFCASSVT